MNSHEHERPQMNVQEIIEQIKGLSEQERAELLNQFRSPITVIFCANSAVNGISIPINNTDNWQKILEKIPPETLGDFLHSIGDFAKNRL